MLEKMLKSAWPKLVEKVLGAKSPLTISFEVDGVKYSAEIECKLINFRKV